MNRHSVAMLGVLMFTTGAIVWAQTSKVGNSAQDFSEAFYTIELLKLQEKVRKDGDRFDVEREFGKIQEKHEKVFGAPLSPAMLGEFERATREVVNTPPITQNADPGTAKKKGGPGEWSPNLFLAEEKLKILEKMRKDGDKFNATKEFSKVGEKYERNFGESMPTDMQDLFVRAADEARTIVLQQQTIERAVPMKPMTVPAKTSTNTAPLTVTRGVRYAEGLPDWFMSHDRNGDGQVGLYEWERPNFAEFKLWDFNGDGLLEQVEVLARLRKLGLQDKKETPPPFGAQKPNRQ